MFSIKSLEINIKRLNEFQTFTFHMNVRPPNFERQISSKIAFRVKKPVFGRERKNGPFNKIKQNFARIWKVFQDVKTNPNKIGCFCP